ncbi:MAG: KH domain-containing protein [Ignavibacteria bacterium]|nr:KH domain-containing protein [Ignavibacteria bacterium]
MKEFIEYIAKNLVDKPEAVKVEEIQEGDNRIKYVLYVDDAETGKVIGKLGRTAKSIRTLLSAVAAKQGKRVIMEIPDKNKKESENLGS